MIKRHKHRKRVHVNKNKTHKIIKYWECTICTQFSATFEAEKQVYF